MDLNNLPAETWRQIAALMQDGLQEVERPDDEQRRLAALFHQVINAINEL